MKYKNMNCINIFDFYQFFSNEILVLLSDNVDSIQISELINSENTNNINKNNNNNDISFYMNTNNSIVKEN